MLIEEIVRWAGSLGEREERGEEQWVKRVGGKGWFMVCD